MLGVEAFWGVGLVQLEFFMFFKFEGNAQELII